MADVSQIKRYISFADIMELTRINLRGTVFKTRHKVMQKILESFPTEEDSCPFYDDKNDEYFFDRDPKMFNAVLDFHTNGTFHLPPDICSVHAREELCFWGIDKSHIQNCCLKILYDDDLDNFRDLLTIEPSQLKPGKVKPHQETNSKDDQTYKTKIWHICNNPDKSFIGKMWVAFVMLNTVISVVVYGLNTTKEFRKPRDRRYIPNITLENEKMMLFLETENCISCEILDIISNLILFIDLMIRLAVCPQKKQFILSVGTICEFTAAIAVVFIIIADHKPEMHADPAVSSLLTCIGLLYSTRVIRVLRVLGLFKEVRILYLCVCKSSKDLLLLIFTFLSFALIFGAAMFWAEFQYSGQFYNYFISVWWAIVTMTTVGYGEYYPTTVPGYIVGVITALFGLMILAVPVAILSSNFSNYYTCYKYKEKHDKKEKCKLISKI